MKSSLAGPNAENSVKGDEAWKKGQMRVLIGGGKAKNGGSSQAHQEEKQSEEAKFVENVKKKVCKFICRLDLIREDLVQ